MPKGIPKNGVNKGWFKRGQRFSSVFKKKMSLSHKGKKPHSFTTATRLKMSESASIRAVRELGERMWGGTKKEYLALHHQVRSLYGRPSKCEKCGAKKRGRKIHWANITGLPILLRSNWKRLCLRCHYAYDRK